jgi:hypothetical protein
MRAAVIESGIKYITDGLVLDLDAAQLRSYSGSGSTWNTLTNNSNNATLINSPSFSTDNGGILNFNGTNQYATLTGSVNNYQYGTVEAWININTPSDNLPHRYYDRANTGTQTIQLRKTSLNGVQASMRLSNGTAYNSATFTAYTGWVCIAAAYDSTGGRYYVNGSIFSFFAISGLTLDTGGTPTYAIGSTSTNVVNLANAKIAIVRSYNRGLSAAELLQNYNALKSRFGL